MLVCRDVTELTTDYLEGALPARVRLALRWHLSLCSFCRRHLRQVRQTVALLHRMGRPQPSLAMEDHLVQTLAACPDPRSGPDTPPPSG